MKSCSEGHDEIYYEERRDNDGLILGCPFCEAMERFKEKIDLLNEFLFEAHEKLGAKRT